MAAVVMHDLASCCDAGKHAWAHAWWRICQSMHSLWAFLSLVWTRTAQQRQACFRHSPCFISTSIRSRHFVKTGLMGSALCRPYFLPCLVAAVLAAITLVLSIIFVGETLPSMQKAAPDKTGD